jgi:hypothetical protein
LLVAAVACQETLPTALSDASLPDEPLTLEVQLPWSEYGSDFEVLGGYSSASALPLPLVTRAYLGALEARTLMRFDTFPAGARVNDNGVIVTDTDLAFVAGFLTVGFDTLKSVAPGPVALELGGLQEEWEAGTASWTLAVDTVGDQRAWSEIGAGPAPVIATRTWDPANGDSVTFALDSAAIATWVDPADQTRGARLLTTTDGTLLVLNRARLRLSIRPSVSDTIVEDTVNILDRTVVFDPAPIAPTGMRAGGVPAWRTLLTVAPPELNGPPELCAELGCPYTPQAGQISYAALRLTTRASEAEYRPFDTLLLDVRSVLSAAALPKSPLGTSETAGAGQAVAPEAFGSAPGDIVELPITSFMRTLMDGPDDSGNDPPGTLAILSASEPSSLPFASFDGPGDPGAPVLKMILTVGAPQVLP